MNAYFLTLTNEEREAIKNQHKEIYDGFKTEYGQNKEQPLYIEDFAKDKEGITVNNKGEVSEYKNMNINEMRYDNKDTGLFSEEANVELDEDFYAGADYDPEATFEGVPPKDGIGDGPNDLIHGTMENPEDYKLKIDDITNELEDDVIIVDLTEQVNKTLDMFKRFKNY